MLCLFHYGPALLRFWFQTDLGHENSASCFKITGGEDLFLPWSRTDHALRPIFMLWLVKIWKWVLAENYASSWNLFTSTAEAGRVLGQL